MKASDTCYYMSITKEENSAFVVSEKQSEPKATIPKDQTACSLLSNEIKPGDAEEGGGGDARKPDGSNVVQYDLPQVILQAPASSTPNASPSRILQANNVSCANFTVATCECHRWIYSKNRPNTIHYTYSSKYTIIIVLNNMGSVYFLFEFAYCSMSGYSISSFLLVAYAVLRHRAKSLSSNFYYCVLQYTASDLKKDFRNSLEFLHDFYRLLI